MLKKIFLLLITLSTLHSKAYDEKLSVLYRSIDPNSLTQLLAFYHLYPEHEVGKEALAKASNLINKHRIEPITSLTSLDIPSIDLDAIISLATKQSYQNLSPLSEDQLNLIEHVCSHLKNRSLKGRNSWDRLEIVEMDPDEIDLGHAILLFQFEPGQKNEIRNYEAHIDLMALQILSRLPPNPSEIQMLDAINYFIFHEMRFRFPPHSMWAKDVDLYTFLPDVLDSRHGVCLGVSTLFLNLAQRVGLPLEVVTPPGHIYLRYNRKGRKINIETTARGIDMPDENYLNINTRSLKVRTVKEVIGLNFLNAAATAWQRNDSEKAVDLYTKALLFMPGDPLVYTFMGYNLLFLGKIEEGRKTLSFALENSPPEFIYGDSLIKDYLDGNVDPSGIKLIYQEVDETRESILKKQRELKKLLKKYPKFRDGIFHLAITYLQLGRGQEAMEILDHYHKLDKENPTVEYYLSILSMQRYQYQKAYDHIYNCEKILKEKEHYPKALFSLKESLRKESLPLVRQN